LNKEVEIAGNLLGIVTTGIKEPMLGLHEANVPKLKGELLGWKVHPQGLAGSPSYH